MKVKDKVQIVKLRMRTHMYLSCHRKKKTFKNKETGRNETIYVRRQVRGKTGKVIEILNNGKKDQGIKVRFPGGWKWSFHFDEVELRN